MRNLSIEGKEESRSFLNTDIINATWIRTKVKTPILVKWKIV